MSYEVNKYGYSANGASYIQTPILPNTVTSSLMGWVYNNSSLPSNARLGFGDGSGNYNYYIHYSKSHNKIFVGVKEVFFSYDFTMIVNEKAHLSMTLNNGVVKGYLNGVEIISESYNSYTPDHNLFLNYVYTDGVVINYEQIVYDVKYFNSVLNQAQIQSEMTSDNITAVGHWTLNQTLDDSSPNGNDATVTGTEQYALISTETVYGTKCTKTETFEQDANDTFDELIYDWFYGGSIKIEVDNLAWKTIKILAYDDESNSYLPIKIETTTLREHTIVIPKTATRRLKLSIDSDSTFTKVVYTLESIFDVINDTDSNSSGAVAIDYNVIYSDVNIEKRSMSFRVNDSDAHFAQSILQNKVYLDDEIHQITSLQVSELDVNTKEFKCDFLRLLNE